VNFKGKENCINDKELQFTRSHFHDPILEIFYNLALPIKIPLVWEGQEMEWNGLKGVFKKYSIYWEFSEKQRNSEEVMLIQFYPLPTFLSKVEKTLIHSLH
jgi:hypothetical protein